ncbi:phage portal protein [Streptomyces sp. NPDC019937]|uniref:phage portal protein n=1 Tax=Streptomyces sp. NPDC019937 TaxID=3154787 RepID=UPI0033F2D3D1
MARWNPLRRLRRQETQAPDTTKALGAPASAPQTFTPAQVGTLVAATAQAARDDGTFQPLPRSEPQVPFGPGVPLAPAAIDPLQPSGRTEPRFNEYPVTSNLPGVGDRLVPWKVLRDAADAGGLPRRCIEIRKAEVTTLDWAITITKEAVEAAQAASPDRPRAEVEQELRQSLSAEMVRCARFWQKPDPGQDENFSEWVGKLLEEHFVLDAIAIYPRRTYGGDLYALEVLDGSTIKPLRDHRGGRPLPPNPAFQQILWGFPRGEFVADVDDDGQVIGGYQTDQLVYKRRNVRAHTPYGYSAVEQALEDVDVWLRRRKWIRDEYTEGTVPAGFLKNSGQTSWTPSQIAEYETSLNDVYNGSTAARHRMRVLPPGFDIDTPQDFGEKYKPEYDLFLIKQIAAHFDVTIAELGFTETGGLGSTGWHEGQADVQQRKATLPTSRWLQQLLTAISRSHLRMPPELEFRFLGLEEEDEAAADEVARQRVMWGRMTINEDRDRLGMARFDFPEADMPMVMTSRGVVVIEGASQRGAPGTTVTVPKGGSDARGEGSAEDDEEPLDEPDDEAEVPDDDQERQAAVKAELAAFGRWARRNPRAGRRFEFSVVTKADAPDLVGDGRVTFAVAGADAGPKVPDADSVRDWPGWQVDLKAVAYWKPRIRKAMRDAVDTRRLAEQWIAQRAITGKSDDADLSGVQRAGGDSIVIHTDQDATSWLTAHGVDLAVALGIIRQLRAEGYLIGERSASAVLAGHSTVDWSAWKPGDPKAASLVLRPDGSNGLTALLEQAGTTIRSVAANRMDKLAAALSRALERGDSADSLAADLRGILDDPAWAERVAVTEISRAMSAAALTTYQANGVSAKSWLTAVDDRVCAICLNNEGVGPVTLTASFPSGAQYPPAHPSCRCTIYPETGAAGLVTYTR